MVSANPIAIASFTAAGVQTADIAVYAGPCKILGVTFVHGGDTEAILLELRDQAVTGTGTAAKFSTGKPVTAAAGSGVGWHTPCEGMRFATGLALKVSGADSAGDWYARVSYEKL